MVSHGAFFGGQLDTIPIEFQVLGEFYLHDPGSYEMVGKKLVSPDEEAIKVIN